MPKYSQTLKEGLKSQTEEGEKKNLMVYYMDENAETQYKTIELEEITPGTVWNEVKDVNPELGGVRFQKKIKR